MIVPIITFLLCVFVGVLVWLNNKGLSEVHARRAEKTQLSLYAKNLAVLREAKLALKHAGTYSQDLDGLIIELRQGIAFLKEQNLHETHARVLEALDRVELLAIETGTHHRDMQILINDPRVQRAIKSG